MRLKALVGGEWGEPGMSLYEIDASGRVLRHVQSTVDGVRFLPEDLVLLRPIDPVAMLRHPSVTAVDAGSFEQIWSRLEDERGFVRELPDVAACWQGFVHGRRMAHELLWLPSGETPDGWQAVLGFRRLFTRDDGDAVARALFLGRPVWWQSEPVAA